MSAVKDQGYCGSCWAFGATAAIESHVALNTGLLFDLSVQQVSADFHIYFLIIMDLSFVCMKFNC